jgi:hypothetical protein
LSPLVCSSANPELKALSFKEHQLNISVKQAALENIKGVSELFNSYSMFYKQETDMGLASDFISERI